jgi:hypothetical protein
VKLYAHFPALVRALERVEWYKSPSIKGGFFKGGATVVITLADGEVEAAISRRHEPRGALRLFDVSSVRTGVVFADEPIHWALVKASALVDDEDYATVDTCFVSVRRGDASAVFEFRAGAEFGTVIEKEGDASSLYIFAEWAYARSKMI